MLFSRNALLQVQEVRLWLLLCKYFIRELMMRTIMRTWITDLLEPKRLFVVSLVHKTNLSWDCIYLNGHNKEAKSVVELVLEEHKFHGVRVMCRRGKRITCLDSDKYKRHLKHSRYYTELLLKKIGFQRDNFVVREVLHKLLDKPAAPM